MTHVNLIVTFASRYFVKCSSASVSTFVVLMAHRSVMASEISDFLENNKIDTTYFEISNIYMPSHSHKVVKVTVF